MGGLRGQEILIIVILLILVFGWKRLPDAARSLGRSARVFKSEVEEMRKDGKEETADGTVQSQATDQRPPQQVTPPPAPYQPQQPPQAQEQPNYQQQQSQQPNYQPPQPHTPDDPTRPVA